jgi:hypothetical protein
MRSLQIVHAIVTLLLLVTILALGVLVLVGVVEVRFPNNAPGNERPAAESRRAKARLLVVRGARPNTEYPIYEGQNIIGRADEKPVDIDLEIQESPDRIWSSRQHAVITCENGSLVIEDLNSSNGTYVNRNRVRPGQKQLLQGNDTIQIGEVQLKVLF